MKVTINDIAKAANVSKSTVSKVMNNSPSISIDTKKKVHRIMKEMNYIPNPSAKQLAKQNSTTIGLFLNAEHKKHFLDPFFFSIIGGVENVLVKNDFDLNIGNIGIITDTDEFFRKNIYNRKYCGLILPIISLKPDFINKLKDIDIPYVIIGCSTANKNLPCFDIDNIKAGELATLHLLDQGNRSIVYIGGNLKSPITSSRLEGYEKAHIKSNVPVNSNLVIHGVLDETSSYNSIIKLFSSGFPIDGIVCEDNYIAYGCIMALKELGVSIPSDTAIITFNDYPLAPYMTPKLSCVHMDTFELGCKVANYLLNKINNKEVTAEPHLINPQLIVRESSMHTK